MAGERKYTRIPPESTGDRVYMIHTAELRYDNKDVNHLWDVGAIYYLTGAVFDSNSDFTVHIHGVQEESTTAGVLSVHYQALARHNGFSPEDDQEIRVGGIDGQIVAYVNGPAEDIYIPAQNIMSFDNPEYGLNVDRFGSANMRFAEGPAQVSAFGGLRTTESTLLGQYNFDKSILPSDFANTLIGSGTIAHDPDWGYVVESVGVETGALTTQTTNLYHPSIPGASNLFVIGNKLGDIGTPGLVRNWGCFDASQGFMFRLNGTTLQVVHRRTFSVGAYNDAADGSEDGKSEGVVPQSSWNRDKLDGTGGSGMALDLTKANSYFIDYQNIGGGTIRWGVYHEGERIVCHEMDMGNGGPLGIWVSNAIRLPSRPICWSMKRIDGGQGDVQTRYQYPLGAAAFIEGVNVDVMAEADVRGYDGQFDVDVNVPRTQGAYYLVSLRPKLDILSSDGVTLISNHSLYTPTNLSISARDSVTATKLPGELRIFSRCLLKNENWVDIPSTNLQQDRDAFHEGHGPEIFRKGFDGFGEIDWTNIFKTIQSGSLKPNAEKNTAKTKQAIAEVSDRNGFVYITVGIDSKTGASTHLFEDGTSLTIAGLTTDGPANLNNVSYLLGIESSDDAYLYASQSDYDDDRTCRVITYSGLTGTLNIGDTITLGADTCDIQKFDGTQIKVRKRSADIDAYTGVATTDAGATFNVDSIGLANTTADDDDIDYLWPKDHFTVLKAVTNAGWANTSQVGGDGTLEGNPPKAPVWTFMWAPFITPTGAEVHKVNMNMNWKERLQ